MGNCCALDRIEAAEFWIRLSATVERKYQPKTPADCTLKESYLKVVSQGVALCAVRVAAYWAIQFRS
jgi:hypothetical protein